MSVKEIWQKFTCWFFGHDPKVASAYNVGTRYIVTYVCACGKKMEIDETVINLPWIIIKEYYSKILKQTNNQIYI